MPIRENEPRKEHTTSLLKVRPFVATDMPTVAGIAQRNFTGHSYSLFPDAVVSAYLQANSPETLSVAMAKPGTETYVVEDRAGEVSGYFFLRHHGSQTAHQSSYGELDLRRTQVDPDKQGKGVARTILSTVEKRGLELGALSVSTQGAGASRDFFERNGWKGRTILNTMEPIPAVVFACSKELGERDRDRYPRPTQLVIASTSPRKVAQLRNLIGGDIPVIPAESIESSSTDVIEVALGKAHSVEASLTGSRRDSAIVATDVRTDIMVHDGNQFVFANRGKSKTREDAIDNFAAMLAVAEMTGKPTPYVVRRATAIVNPDTGQESLTSEKDISVWLTADALKFLSDPRGFEQYRQAVLDEYGRDVMQNAASFALQYFVKNGMVAGMNGYLFNSIPNRDGFLRHADSIVYGAPDQALLNERLSLV